MESNRVSKRVIVRWAVACAWIVFSAGAFNLMLEGKPGEEMAQACPVTLPNGSPPPGEIPSLYHHGNGKLWTALWESGIVRIAPVNAQADGSLTMKWPWWRGVEGALGVEGRRLNAPADPLRADIPDGYGPTGIQASGLIFPTAGCWQITASAGGAHLTIVVLVVRVEQGDASFELTGQPSTPEGGLPVMPEALFGDLRGAGYLYTVNATSAEIEAFYVRELPALGWAPGIKIPVGNGNVALQFQQADRQAFVVTQTQTSGPAYVSLWTAPSPAASALFETQSASVPVCPVTEPKWLKPPHDDAVLNEPDFGYYFVNQDRSIWASAWWAVDEKYPLRVSKEGVKVGWFRPAGVELLITGQRLDGLAPPLEAHASCCYPTRFQASGLYFPTQGCWEVTATAADRALSFVVKIHP